MTAAEHYAEAERILQNSSDGGLEHLTEEEAQTWMSSAQVHATLALTQATLATFEAADWDKS